MHWGKCIVPTVSIRRDSNLIKGCESALWLSHSLSDGRHYFLVDSDSVVIKGLAALILCRVNAKASVDILAVDFDQYFSILGLQKHLSPSRLNGIHALLKTIRTYC
jgi:sulfur transfer protein SufE